MTRTENVSNGARTARYSLIRHTYTTKETLDTKGQFLKSRQGFRLFNHETLSRLEMRNWAKEIG